MNREGIRGTGVKSGGFDHFGNGSKGSGGAAFKWGRLGFHHGRDLWRLRQPEVVPPGGLCRKELQAEREGEGKEGKEEVSISEFRENYFGLKKRLKRDEAEMW